MTSWRKVFPDGRTVHVPTDGVPLKGYELAKADIEKRGDGDDAATVGKSLVPGVAVQGQRQGEDERRRGRGGGSRPPEPAKPAPVVVAAAKARVSRAAPAPRAKTPRDSSWRRLTCSRCSRRSRKPAAGRRQGRAEAADAGRHHQCPRLLGRRFRRRRSRRRRRRVAAISARKALERRRSATDRERAAGLSGAGLRAAVDLAGRPRQHRRRLRADPAQRPRRRAQCRGRGDRDQHRRDQGRAGPG